MPSSKCTNGYDDDDNAGFVAAKNYVVAFCSLEI